MIINEDGWTNIQEADKKKHVVQISCYAEKGIIKEIRKCHNDGEEVKIKGAINSVFSLPMSIAEFEDAFYKIDW